MAAIEFRPLTADDVECRVSQVSQHGVQLLIYKDARCDMRLLDETVGPENWQCKYESIDGKLFCGIGCRFKDGEWVWKWDTGTPSNMESQKGEASDAFKRAGFKWGIGRELYTAPSIWVDRDKCKKLKEGRNGKEQCYDDFRVTEMEVADGVIDKLVICNASNRMAVVYGSATEAVEESKPSGNDEADMAWMRVKQEVWAWCKRHGCATEEESGAKIEGIKKRPQWETQSRSIEWLDSVAHEFRNG